MDLSWKLEAGSWKLEAGSWKLEAGSWKLEAGSWKSLRPPTRPSSTCPQPASRNPPHSNYFQLQALSFKPAFKLIPASSF
jgi:hypothetical protein